MKADSKPYHHVDGRFRNPPGSPPRSATAAQWAGFLWRSFMRSRNLPEPPPGHVLDPAEAAAALDRFDGRDSLTWLGHASFLIRAGGKAIVTDPYLTDFAGPLDGFGPRRFAGPGLPIADLPEIDVLVLSHNHYDHLDARALAALPGKESMTVVVPLRLGDFFRARGFRDVREVDWHDHVAVGDVTITALPAIHFSRRGLFDTNKTLWMSVAVTAPGQRLFFSGDTAYGPVFAEIGDRYGPFDTALIGIGAYEPQSIMRASHSTPEEAVRMARDLRADTVVGMHWGTVVLTDEPPFEPPERFRRAAQAAGFDDERVWLMKIGETRALPRAWPSN